MSQDHPDWSTAQTVTLEQIVVGSGSTSAALDISRYATLVIRVFDVGGINPPALTYQQISPAGSVCDTALLSADQLGESFTYIVPVIGSTIQFINNLNNGMTVEVTGINGIQSRQLAGQFYGADVRGASIANGTASGVNTKLVSSLLNTNNPNNQVTGFNGGIAIRFSVSVMGGATQWTLYAVTIQEDGTKAFIPVTEVVAAGSKEMTIGHPNTFTSWYVINSGALTAGVTVSLSILPSA